MVNGKQLMLLWYVDDIKASHVMKTVVTKFIKWLKCTYECIFEDGSGAMWVSRGKKHDYLRMQLDFTKNGKVKLTMDNYVADMVKDFYPHDKTTRTAKTPTAEHIFRVNDDAVPLPQEGIPIFYNFVARALFLVKHA